MKRITIYAKGQSNIERFDVFIYEKKLLKILEELDNFYGVQTGEKEYYGQFVQDLKEGEFYESVSAELINRNVNYTCNTNYNVYKYTARYIKTDGLSKIVREILNSDPLGASYAVNELCNYYCKTDEEKEFLENIKSCFRFKKNDKKFDLTKLLLEFERKLFDDDVKMKFIDDKITTRIDNIPYSQVFNKKHE